MKSGVCTWTVIMFQRKSIWYFIAYSLCAIHVQEQYKDWNISYQEASKKLFTLCQVNKLQRFLQYYLNYG